MDYVAVFSPLINFCFELTLTMCPKRKAQLEDAFFKHLSHKSFKCKNSIKADNAFKMIRAHDYL